MTKLKAIQYLIQNNEYGNEWQGAGMWEAVVKVMSYKGRISERYLKKLLAEAEDF